MQRGALLRGCQPFGGEEGGAQREFGMVFLRGLCKLADREFGGYFCQCGIGIRRARALCDLPDQCFVWYAVGEGRLFRLRGLCGLRGGHNLDIPAGVVRQHAVLAQPGAGAQVLCIGVAHRGRQHPIGKAGRPAQRGGRNFQTAG